MDLHATVEKDGCDFTGENSTSGMCWYSSKKLLVMWACAHLQKTFDKIFQSVKKIPNLWQNEIKGPSWINNWLKEGEKDRKEHSVFVTESDNQWNLLLEPVLFNIFIQENKSCNSEGTGFAANRIIPCS